MQEFLLASVAVLYFTVFALLWGDDTADEKQKQVFFFVLFFWREGDADHTFFLICSLALSLPVFLFE